MSLSAERRILLNWARRPAWLRRLNIRPASAQRTQMVKWVVSPTEPELGPSEVYYALGISPSTKPKAIDQAETSAVSNYTGSGYDQD
jgi:hypothetical protein